MGRCEGSSPQFPGRRGAICARKSNKGNLYRARNRVCSGFDIPALTPKLSEMISESSRSRNPAGHAGLLQNLFALVNALAEFFESRFALLAEESKAAAVQLLILAGCIVFAVLLCALGYVFLITGAVVGLAHLAGISWPWIALAAAALHFIIALVLLLIAWSRITKPFFRVTLAELRKDREWLRSLDTTNQSTN